MKLEMHNPFTGQIRLVNDQDAFNQALIDGFIDLECEARGDSDGSYLEDNSHPLNKSVKEEKPEKLSKDKVLKALKDIRLLNAAISCLGDLQTEDELNSGITSHMNGKGFSAAFARTGRRLWMWVTGKDPKTMEVRWEPKCLSHHRASSSFRKQLNNYKDFETAVDLAEYVAGFHWRQLEHILDNNFIGIELQKIDKKPFKKSTKNLVSLSGAKVVNVSGGGTQLLWDSRKVWLPSSQIKNVSGELKIPEWLAKKNGMV